MAIVTDGFYGEITVMDRGGQKTTRRWKLQAATQEDAETDFPLVVTAFLALTDCVLVSRSFGEVFINDALAFPAVAQLQNQALLDFLITDNPTKHATQSIPGPKDTLFMAATGPGSDDIDPADAAIVAWVAMFGPAGQLYLSDGETADVFVAGRRRHIRSNRG